MSLLSFLLRYNIEDSVPTFIYTYTNVGRPVISNLGLHINDTSPVIKITWNEESSDVIDYYLVTINQMEIVNTTTSSISVTTTDLEIIFSVVAVNCVGIGSSTSISLNRTRGNHISSVCDSACYCTFSEIDKNH